MDHILELPADPAFQPVHVPYIYGGNYDNQGLRDFPRRKGWNLDRLYKGDLQGRSELDVRRLLQDWLYFGTLSEFLGSTLDALDFTCDDDESPSKLRISTKSLEKRLARWRSRVMDLDEAAQHERSKQVLECLDIVSTATQSDTLRDLMGPELHLGVCILGSTLDKARLGLRMFADPTDAWSSRGQKQNDTYYRFGVSTILMDRLTESGWCPNQIIWMQQNLTPIAIYYTTLLKRPPDARDHSVCTVEVCNATRVDDATFKTEHAKKDCVCHQMCPDQNQIAQIIESGDMPLIAIRPGVDPDTWQIRVVAAGLEQDRNNLLSVKAPYVAISHVWKDGLGNARDNSIATCQIQKLWSSVSAIYSKVTDCHNIQLQKRARRLRYGRASLDDGLFEMKLASSDSGMIFESLFESTGSKSRSDEYSRLNFNPISEQKGASLYGEEDEDEDVPEGSKDNEFHFLINDSPSRDFMPHHGKNSDFNFDWKAYDMKEIWKATRFLSKKEYGDEVIIWLDTLCIPLDNKLRLTAIRRMKEVYANAEKVLVLDKELQQVPASTSYEENLMRINLCGWMQRAWTLEEAAVGSILFFQFSDGVFSLWTYARTWFRKATRSMILADASRPWIDIRRLQQPRHHMQQLQMAHDTLEHRAVSKKSDLNIIFSFLMGVNIKNLILPVEKRPSRARTFLSLQDEFKTGFMWVPNAEKEENYQPVAISKSDITASGIYVTKDPKDSHQYFQTLSHLKNIAPYREEPGYVLRCPALNLRRDLAGLPEIYLTHITTGIYYHVTPLDATRDAKPRRENDTAMLLMPLGPPTLGCPVHALLVSFYERTHLGGHRLTRDGINFSTFRCRVVLSVVSAAEIRGRGFRVPTGECRVERGVEGRGVGFGPAADAYREDTMWCLE